MRAQDGTVPRALRLKEKTKVYVGLNKLYAIVVDSDKFQQECKKQYKLQGNLPWYVILARSAEKLLGIESLNPELFEQIFQKSKRCSAETAAQAIAVVRAYSGDERSIKNWRLRYTDYKSDDRIFKKYFRYTKEEHKVDSISDELLHGSWAVYTSKTGSIYRSLMELNTETKDHLYFITSDRLRLTHCELKSNALQASVCLEGSLEYTDWSYSLNGDFFMLPDTDGKSFIKGIAQITNKTLIQNTPVLMVRTNDKIEFDLEHKGKTDTTPWSRLKPLKSFTESYSGERSCLVYYQMLVDGQTDFFNLEPSGQLKEWLKTRLKKLGRNKFQSFKKYLKSKKWFSMSRKPNDPDEIRIYRWTFDFHEFRQSITARRKGGGSAFDNEASFEGEMKFHNDRFWIEFSSEGQHKIMFMRARQNDFNRELYFLAMGSSTFVDQARDLGDMITEILLPDEKLPDHFHDRTNITYTEFKDISTIPIDMKLYLNHRDHSILSFENPKIDDSRLRKQKDAIAYSGHYLVYVYHKHFDEAFRLIRYTLHIDRLAVATLKKTYIGQHRPEQFSGLAEQFNRNLHLVLKYRDNSSDKDTQDIHQEVQLMVDSQPGFDGLMMTGVLADADQATRPRSMACVLVKADTYQSDSPAHRKLIENVIGSHDRPISLNPKAHCLKSSTEYQLLNQLLWERQKTPFTHIFKQLLVGQRLTLEGFLEKYFGVMGSVFYSDYGNEAEEIRKALKKG